MRAVLALLFFLTACSSAEFDLDLPPPASPPVAAYVEILAAAQQNGQWFLHDGGLTVAASFGVSESEYLLTIVCDYNTGIVKFTLAHEPSLDQDTTLTFITMSQAIPLPAHSARGVTPSVRSMVDGDRPELAALLTVQDRFAARVDSQTYVFPWDVDVGRTLAACGARW